MELQIVEKTLPAVQLNTKELRAQAEEYLKQYENFVVTEESLAGAREVCTELNKVVKAIEDRRKEIIGELSGPINAADAEIKEIKQLIADVRQGIISQVNEANTARLAECDKKLKDLRLKKWEEYEIEESFRCAQVDDLIKLGSLTAKDNLTKAAATEVESRVTIDRLIQDRTEKRILALDGQSNEYGLKVAIGEHHVKAFLMDEDDEYEEKLQAMLQGELERQMEIERQSKQQAKREDQIRDQMAEEEPAEQAIHEDHLDRVIEQAKLSGYKSGNWVLYSPIIGKTPTEGPYKIKDIGRIDSSDEPVLWLEGKSGCVALSAVNLTNNPTSNLERAETAQDDGLKGCIVTCTFALRIDKSIDQEAIKAELRKVMEEAGIDTLDMIKVDFTA